MRVFKCECFKRAVILLCAITYLSDLSRVADALVVADALIVVPKLDHFVVATGDEVLSSIEDGESVELTRVRAVKHANGLAVVAVPVGDLAVGTSGEQLRLVRVVHDCLEHC